MVYYYYLKIPSLKKTFGIAKNKSGVCSITFTYNEKLYVKTLTEYYGEEVVKSKAKLEKDIKQVQEYFAGKRKSFDMHVFLKGTKFQTQVWLEISKLKFGETISYSELAKRLKNKGAVRAVGSACGRNPVPVVIPCHRVLAKNSLGGFGGGIELKKKMLKLENIL